jgi:ubiquitin-conjugating enzyme E2 M
MIRVFGVGRGRGAGQASGSAQVAQAPGGNSSKILPGQIRLQTELSELELPPGCSIDFPDPKDLMKFIVSIRPDEGFWRDAKYRFIFSIKGLYPHEPPKVKCETLVYHPNIDLDGNVCLNILREDWKPILSISAVVYGLLHLFLEPNFNDPLNQEAAEVLRNNKAEFSRIVMRTLRGGSHQDRVFPRLI